MKYHILHDFRSSTPFTEKSCDHFKDLHKLELLTNFDVIRGYSHLFRKNVRFKTFVTLIIELLNFSNICSRSIKFQNVLKREASKFLKFQQSRLRHKIEISPQETYKAENFIFRTSIGHYSMTKRISEIYSNIREATNIYNVGDKSFETDFKIYRTGSC